MQALGGLTRASSARGRSNRSRGKGNPRPRARTDHGRRRPGDTFDPDESGPATRLHHHHHLIQAHRFPVPVHIVSIQPPRQYGEDPGQPSRAFHQPPYHAHSPRQTLPPQWPPPNYNPAAFPQPLARRVSVQPPPNQNTWALLRGRNPSPCATTSAQNFYSQPVPYQSQYRTPPPPHHRASLAPPRQPHMHPRSNFVQPPSLRRHRWVPSLTAPLPTFQSLTTVMPIMQQPQPCLRPENQLGRGVLVLIDCVQQGAAGDAPPIGPATVQDRQLSRLLQIAVPPVVQIASARHPAPIPIIATQAVYLRATFATSSVYPDHVQHDPRVAFRDFDQAARAGYAQVWFRLGRDYENFNDGMHARVCFERGVKLNVESSVFRMDMAHLMDQLSRPPQPEIALPFIYRAAVLDSVQVPQPAYVHGLLLLGEFPHVTVPPHFFAPLISPHSLLQQEARLHLERAAFLHFVPAQYKLGHAYEFALAPFPFDALLSVQYYSLASQQGEVEADIALSKWFLCGAEGAFDKDETLAYTFAEKAARKGLGSAEFAMGYYKEVGVGGPKDIDAACMWYQLASDHGNADAVERLAALSQPSPQSLSRQEHDTITESKLVRKRMQAKQRSERGSGGAPRPSLEDSRQVVDVIRKNSMTRHHPHGSGVGAGAGGTPILPPVTELHQQQPPPPGVHAMNTSPQVPQGPPQGPPPQRQFPNQHRYTLVDPGANSASNSPPPSRTDSPGYARPAGRPPGQRTGSMPSPALPPDTEGFGGASQAPPPQRPAAKGPTTFAEMGIQGVKLEEKECVIM